MRIGPLNHFLADSCHQTVISRGHDADAYAGERFSLVIDHSHRNRSPTLERDVDVGAYIARLEEQWTRCKRSADMTDAELASFDVPHVLPGGEIGELIETLLVRPRRQRSLSADRTQPDDGVGDG